MLASALNPQLGWGAQAQWLKCICPMLCVFGLNGVKH